MKMRRGRKVIGCRGEGKHGNGTGQAGEMELERGMRWQRGRRGDKQRIASIGETADTSSGQQTVAIQVTGGAPYRRFECFAERGVLVEHRRHAVLVAS